MNHTGRDFYRDHQDECVSWGLPRPPEWGELSVEDKAGWELQAYEHAEKLALDRRSTHDRTH